MENKQKVKIFWGLQIVLSLMNIVGLVMVIWMLPIIIGFFVEGFGMMLFGGFFGIIIFVIGIFLIFKSHKIKKREIEKLSKII